MSNYLAFIFKGKKNLRMFHADYNSLLKIINQGWWGPGGCGGGGAEVEEVKIQHFSGK